MTSRQQRGRMRTWTLRALLMLVVTFLTFVAVEGCSSTAFFAVRALKAGQQSIRYYNASVERRHAEYDELLGWVGIPNRHIPDLYGPGKYLRTESHGFRNDEEIERAVPAGRRRVICAGDSFAFGQGVANDRTWCHLLSVKNESLQAVNMGQRGYGVDQSYLWYMRDGVELDHDLHVFSFIAGDFNRMQRRAHHGYGRPVLRLEGDRLLPENVPVPRLRIRRPWMSRLGRAASELRSVALARRVLGRTMSRRELPGDGETKEVVRALFTELDRVNREKGSLLVLLWLPVEGEIDRESNRWRRWLEELAAQSGWVFIDLSHALRRLPTAEARGLFIREDETEYVDSAGHYNERGHAWVADELYEQLSLLPEASAVLVPPSER